MVWGKTDRRTVLKRGIALGSGILGTVATTGSVAGQSTAPVSEQVIESFEHGDLGTHYDDDPAVVWDRTVADHELVTQPVSHGRLALTPKVLDGGQIVAKPGRFDPPRAGETFRYDTWVGHEGAHRPYLRFGWQDHRNWYQLHVNHAGWFELWINVDGDRTRLASSPMDRWGSGNQWNIVEVDWRDTRHDAISARYLAPDGTVLASFSTDHPLVTQFDAGTFSWVLTADSTTKDTALYVDNLRRVLKKPEEKKKHEKEKKYD